MSKNVLLLRLRGSSVHCVLTLLVILLISSFVGASSLEPAGPLVVDSSSHVVVMEYEAWFGPKAATFQGFPAMPLLQSADMQAVGGGYDSADPVVIKRHVAWLESLGMDAVIADLTNNVSCIFDSEWLVEKYVRNCSPAFRSYNRNIRDNTGNLYPAWSGLGTRLKLIPQLGGIEQNVLIPDEDGKNALEKEIAYFGALMERYPERNVIYEGKPLMLIFLGAAQDPNPGGHPLWFRIEEFLQRHPEVSQKYTFKLIAGYLDSQPGLWETQGTPTAPVEINPAYGFWSWVDRLNTTCTEALCPYYPSYNRVGSRVENFTASIATAGQDGWGCPDPNAAPYCPDDALRYGSDGKYDTLDAFMIYAGQLEPIFLIIHQFNEFARPDEGFDADTNDEIEPANLWGNDLAVVRARIKAYREGGR
jgi:hypothetical protein